MKVLVVLSLALTAVIALPVAEENSEAVIPDINEDIVSDVIKPELPAEVIAEVPRPVMEEDLETNPVSMEPPKVVDEDVEVGPVNPDLFILFASYADPLPPTQDCRQDSKLFDMNNH